MSFDEELEKDINFASDLEQYIYSEKGRFILDLINSKIKELDSLKGIKTIKELEGRKYAVKILKDILGTIDSYISKKEDKNFKKL